MLLKGLTVKFSFIWNTTFFLFISIFFSAMLWLTVIPMWHTPDEQSHFAQVAFLAEERRNPGGGALDTTEEIYVSEELLGTDRDKVGNNEFTFHSDFRIEYTDSYYGKYEASISALANTDAKKKMVIQEASYYPKLYYVPASWLYKQFYDSDLFSRVFAVRGWSLILFLTNVFIVYHIGKLIFAQKKLEVFVLTSFVGFQPMMIFSNIGVTSDALGNMLFTLFLYVCIRVILYGMKIKEVMMLITVSWFALNAKVQFFIIIPVLFLLLIFLIIRDFQNKTKWMILLILLLISLFSISRPYEFKQLNSIAVAADSLKEFNLESFLKFSREYTLPHTINEVMPWYWGVYKWLGVTYPRFIHRIINRIVFIAIAGFVIWLIGVMLKRKWKDRQVQGIIFMFFSFTVYFTAISVVDWLSWYRTGFQLAVQGRYFFPFISFHMIAIITGLSYLLPLKRRIKEYGLKLLTFLMVTFNIYALYYVSSYYYDVSSLSRFIIQSSQYKPEIFKETNLLLLIIVFLVFLILTLIQLYSLKSKQKAL